jgi:general secretion pathway protein G
MAAGRGDRGFTLIELITVVAIVAILAAIAVPQYKISIIQAKEGVLREDLFVFRDAIDQYYIDKGKYPASLDALAEEGYQRKIPVDPITQAADWEPVLEELDADRPGEAPGVYDVKSASTQPSLTGTPYNEW